MNRRIAPILIAALFLALLGISFYGGPVTYVFFIIVLLVPLTSLIYVILVIHSLKIYQKTDGRSMVCRSPSDFYITLNNEGWFSFSYLRVIFYSSFSSISGMDDETAYELPPHSSITRKTQLVCKYRGEYKVGIKQIVVRDHFGLFSVTYNIREPLTVIVAPAIVHLSELKSGELFSDADRDKLRERVTPDIPVREYVPGDDVRLLHWKASAAMQRLMVHEKTGEEKSGIALIMDPERCGNKPEDYLPGENKIMECTLALALYYMEQNIPVDVLYRTDTLQKNPVGKPADFEALYDIMQGYHFLEENSVIKLMADMLDGGEAGEYRLFIFVLHRYGADEELWARKINTSHVPVRVYLIGDVGEHEASGPEDRETELIPVGAKEITEGAL